MADKKRRGLGSGLGALIPDSQKEKTDRPIDVFFGKKTGDKAERVGAEDKSDASPQKNTARTSDTTDSNAETANVSRETLDRTGTNESVARNDASPDAPLTNERANGERFATQTNSSDSTQGATETTDAVVIEEQPELANLQELSSSSPSSSGDKSPHHSPTRSQQDDDSARSATVNASSETVGSTAGAATSSDDDTNDGLVSVPGATFAEIPLNMIVANHAQPRTVFDEDDLEELAQSIAEVGVLQPIVVRPLDKPLPDRPEARYEIIMGERRWRASQRASLDAIPAIVRRTEDDDMLRDALLENLHRIQLNPLEEAAAYQQLIDDFGYTQEELSKRVARSRPQISNTLRLMKLPSLVQRRVAAGVLSAGHARALLGLDDPAAMEYLAQRIVAEGLSVRQTEEIVAMTTDPAPAPQRRRRAKRFAPELGALASRLGDRLNTKVAVNMGARKGSIKVDFANLDDLNRILAVLAPGEAVDPDSDSGDEFTEGVTMGE